MSDTIASLSPATATPAAPARLRLTRRGRFVFTFLASVPLVGVLLLAGVNGGAALASFGESGELNYVTVTSGESLWSLAQSVDPSADPRDVVAEIMSLNGLESASVEAGQQLALPAR